MKKNIIIVVLLVALAVAYWITQSTKMGASVFDGGYQYTHLTSANASSTSGTLVRGGAGILGSVTINTTGAQIVGIYDGNTAATTTATKIAAIKASVGEQTFVYDVALTKGLVMELPATYAGDITVSSK